MNLFKIKIPIILILISVLVFGFICVYISSHSVVYLNSSGNNTIISELKKPCCDSGPLHYFDSWQDTFLATFRDIQGIYIFLFLVLLIYFINRSSTYPVFRIIKYKEKIKYGRPFLFIPTQYLQYAFSKGILKPKLF